jgi:DNA (cytosine-5)-methyltransferase 1
VLDFLDDCVSDSDGDSSTLIGLADFKSNFHQWITMRFPHDLAFQKWIKAFGNKLDFRAAFHANAEFLWHQATDTTDEDERKSRLKHPVWNDCGFNGINLEKIDVICEKTVATPFVYNSFSSMYFGKELEQVNPTPSVFEAQSRRKRQLGFAKDKLFHPQIEEPQAKVSTTTSRRAPIAIKVGDVISVPPDQNGKWRKNNTYYAYVQGVRHKQVRMMQHEFVQHVTSYNETRQALRGLLRLTYRAVVCFECF